MGKPQTCFGRRGFGARDLRLCIERGGSIDDVVLCGASAYNRKFYLNEQFCGLPEQVKDELKIMCVLFTEDVGGIFQMIFNGDGELEFRTSCDEGDLLYDEIGCVLKVKELQRKKQELLEALENVLQADLYWFG